MSEGIPVHMTRIESSRSRWVAVEALNTDHPLLEFFKCLDRIPEEDAAWPEVSAGLLVVRYAVRVLAKEQPGPGSLEEVGQHVSKVFSRSVRDHLQGILAAAASDIQNDQVLTGRLMAYGHTLHADGYFGLAVDVFGAICNNTFDDPATRMAAMRWQAYAQRCLGRFDEATMTYCTLKEFARRRGEKAAELRAQLGESRILMEVGNYPEAERNLKLTYSRARLSGEGEVLGEAANDLGNVAGARHDPAGVIRYAAIALHYITEPRTRDRAELNMAFAFREMEYADAAGRLAGKLAATAQDLEDRLRAQILLYELAIFAEDEAESERLRRELQQIKLPHLIEVNFHKAAAVHAAMLGDRSRAIRHLQHVIAVAGRNRQNEDVMRAEQALANVRAGEVPPFYVYRPVVRIPAGKRRAVRTVEANLGTLCGV